DPRSRSMANLGELRNNPALLKLDLYCRGIRIEDSCHEGHGGRKILRTRAGLGSGLELVLPGGLWTNVPVMEPFAKDSPFALRSAEAKALAIHLDGQHVAEVRLAPQPLG